MNYTKDKKTKYEIVYIINYSNGHESQIFKQHSIFCERYDVWRNCMLLENYDGCIKYFIFENNIPLSPNIFDQPYDQTKTKFKEYNDIEFTKELSDAIEYFR
jgi:hypothetical protein